MMQASPDQDGFVAQAPIALLDVALGVPHRVIQVAGSVMTVLGVSPGHLLGDVAQLLATVHPEDQAKLLGLLGTSEIGQCEVRWLRPASGWMWVLIQSATSVIGRRVLVLTDVTAVRTAAEARGIASGDRPRGSLPADATAEVRLHGLRLLVVEDEPDIRQTLALVLAGRGAQVVEAADGIAAVEACAAQRFDAILLDWTLPRLDGRGFLARGACPAPMVVASDLLSPADRAWIVKQGVAEVLDKPYSMAAAAVALARAAGLGRSA